MNASCLEHQRGSNKRNTMEDFRAMFFVTAQIFFVFLGGIQKSMK